MIEIITGFFVFCLVLFIYLHIQFHLKTSNDLERLVESSHTNISVHQLTKV